MRLTGISYRKIARTLNGRAIPSPGRYLCLSGAAKCECYANSLWTVPAVKNVLTSEVYLGHMVQGRKRSGFSEGRKPYQVPESEWVIVRNTHEPLVDEETFHAVQQMAKRASNAYQERLGRYDGLGKIPNVLRGLVCCADCKRTMTRYKNVKNKGTHLYYTYICRTHSSNPASCPTKNIHKTELKEILWDALQREIALAGDLDKLVRQYSHSTKAVGQEMAVKREIAAAKQALTEAMAHALIERVEVDVENHVFITLRYRDEYRALLQLLEAEGKVVST